MSFNAPEAGATGPVQSTGAASVPVRIPAGQSFAFELMAPITSLTAASGDPFSGRLMAPLRDERHRTVARAGSLVKGRLLRVERHHLAPAFTIIVLQIENTQVAGSEIALAAVRDWSRDLVRNRRNKNAHRDSFTASIGERRRRLPISRRIRQWCPAATAQIGER